MIPQAGEAAAVGPGSLRTEDLVARFDGVTVLQGLTLALAAGESLGISGPNGCGKTTLVNVISGFVRAERGRVWLGDREITRWPPYRIVRAGIARTFQAPRLAFRMTVEQNLRAATLQRDLRVRERRQVVNQVLSIVGLETLRSREAQTLSPGEIRRVELGRALATGGHVLLLDEPFASLSPGDASAVLSVLRRLRQHAVSMLIVAHSFAVFQSLCDRVAVIEDGRVIRTGRPAEVVRD